MRLCVAAGAALRTTNRAVVVLAGVCLFERHALVFGQPPGKVRNEEKKIMNKELVNRSENK
jgi:hypothetical protein